MEPPKPESPSGSSDAPIPAVALLDLLLSRIRKSEKGLGQDTLPKISISEMFEAMILKAEKASGNFWSQAAEVPLRLVVATVCSGTEAPLTALDFIQEAGMKLFGTQLVIYQHSFSCEIEPYKQAFIRRNHDPPIIFRNVVELGSSGASRA